jgi:hypothetical protein
MGKPTRVVAALAGRRVDASDADPPRFPSSRTRAVRVAIGDLLRRECVDVLVCSAACGADLLALDAAMSIGLRCRVVLPFAPEEFRRTSVVDRPGDWGELYDSILPRVEASGDLIILDGAVGDEYSYSHANGVILNQTHDVALGGECIAILVWDGRSYGEEDATVEFARMAARNMEIREVRTCD